MMGRIAEIRVEIAARLDRLKSWSRRQRSTWIELLVRDEIERARTVLRLNDFAGCDATLRSAERRLDVEADWATDVLRAVISSLQAQAMRAQATFTGGNTSTADDAFRRAVDAFEGVDKAQLQPRDRADLGIALAALGEWKQARTELEAAVADDKAPPEASRELARVYLELRKPEKAKPVIERAISAIPGDPQLYLLKARAFDTDGLTAADALVQAGIMFLAAGRPSEALDAADRARSCNADVPQVAGVRAEALRQSGRNNEAMPEFDRAIHEATNAQLYVRRAAARAGVGDAAGADADLEHALALGPVDADVLVLASEVRHECGDEPSARELAARAYKQEPGNWRALVRVAEVWRDAGDGLRALDALRSAGPQARLQPRVLRLQLELALIYTDREETIDLFDRVRRVSQLTADETYLLARLLADSGRLDEAIATTGEGLRRWDDDLDLRLLDVELKLTDNAASAALASVEQGVRKYPHHAGMQLLQADALLADESIEQGYEQVARAIHNAAELAPDWAEPWWLQAQVAWRDDDVPATRAALNEVFKRDARHFRARCLEVVLCLNDEAAPRAERYARAERLARALASRGADRPVGRLMLAQVLDAQHRVGEAIAELKDLDELDFGDVEDATEMLTLRAQLSLDMLELEGADRDLVLLAALTSDSAELWRLRSMLARARADGLEASRCADRAVRLAPDSIDIHFEALAAHELADDDAGIERIERALEQRWPDARAVRLWKSQVLAETEPDVALTDVVALVAEDPTDVAAVAELARQHFNRGRYEDALDALGRVKDEPLDADTLALRAEASRMLDLPDQAITDARAALDLVSRHADALATLGLALFDSGQIQQAIDVLKLARTVAPEDDAVRRWLGKAYARDQRFDEALALLDALALEQPGAARPLADLAELLIQAGDFNNAAELYRQVTTLPAAETRVWSLFGWCLLYMDPVNLTEAEVVLRTATSLDDDPWARSNLADVLHLGAEPDQARAIYREIHDQLAGRPSEGLDLLGLDGWCLFRLRELDAASRVLYEASNGQLRTEAEHFDLALVNLCAGNSEGTSLYEQLLPLTDVHPQFQRGLLRVAQVDLERARADFPETAGGSAGERVLNLLTTAQRDLPERPVVQTVLRRAGDADLISDRTAVSQGDGGGVAG